MLEKRSLSLQGHRTSIALEAEFWVVLERAAVQKGTSLPTLITEIDEARLATSQNHTFESDLSDQNTMSRAGLASSLRVFALKAVCDNPQLGLNADVGSA